MSERPEETVEVQEASSGTRVMSGARTSVAAFLAQSVDAEEAGEPSARRIRSWKEFHDCAAITGGSPDGEREASRVRVSGALWAAVYGWFANGGGECYLAPLGGKGGIAGALEVLERVEEISIVVAPDLWSEATAEDSRAAAGLIADHCQRTGNRVAVLHVPDGAPLESAAEMLGIDADAAPYVTVYYPWINVLDADGETSAVPATGHVAGVWARVDARRGVHKAPANEDLRGVVGLTRELDDPEQEVLNDQGVNALRKFPGTAPLVWGARTLAAADPSDVENSYLNVRRTVNFIKQSILQSTRWVVFEPNDDRLGTSVTAMITSFLTGLWRRGMLVGANTEQAFYVVCDESNNSEEEVSQGKLNVEVGVALVRPAEFITFRVSQSVDQSD
ncbi:phage tail sheath family protein [Streptomyces sp. NPDC127108]|uniref:phage tail sheath family protein n=1 Tax=Streptomyces sp. NPDC127108 TaxID=3345361 RepID=UPI00362C8035